MHELLKHNWILTDRNSIVCQQDLPDTETHHNRKKTSYIASIYSGAPEVSQAIAALPEIIRAARDLICNAIDLGECYKEECGEDEDPMWDDWKALDNALQKAGVYEPEQEV